MAYHEEMNPAK